MIVCIYYAVVCLQAKRNVVLANYRSLVLCNPILLLLHYIHLMAFLRTTWVSWHQKGKPFWILPEQEMMGVAVASVGPYANHLHLAPDR